MLTTIAVRSAGDPSVRLVDGTFVEEFRPDGSGGCTWIAEADVVNDRDEPVRIFSVAAESSFGYASGAASVAELPASSTTRVRFVLRPNEGCPATLAGLAAGPIVLNGDISLHH